MRMNQSSKSQSFISSLCFVTVPTCAKAYRRRNAELNAVDGVQDEPVVGHIYVVVSPNVNVRCAS